jgi:hypothetical protein
LVLPASIIVPTTSLENRSAARGHRASYLCCLACRRKLATLAATSGRSRTGRTTSLSITLVPSGVRDFQQTKRGLTCVCVWVQVGATMPGFVATTGLPTGGPGFTPARRNASEPDRTQTRKMTEETLWLRALAKETPRNGPDPDPDPAQTQKNDRETLGLLALAKETPRNRTGPDPTYSVTAESPRSSLT